MSQSSVENESDKRVQALLKQTAEGESARDELLGLCPETLKEEFDQRLSDALRRKVGQLTTDRPILQMLPPEVHAHAQWLWERIREGHQTTPIADGETARDQLLGLCPETAKEEFNQRLSDILRRNVEQLTADRPILEPLPQDVHSEAQRLWERIRQGHQARSELFELVYNRIKATCASIYPAQVRS